MTYANRERDGKILRDVCVMAREMWIADQQRDDTLIDWDKLDDLVHQTAATKAAVKAGVQGKAWRDLIDRHRLPGQTMLQVCHQARSTSK